MLLRQAVLERWKFLNKADTSKDQGIRGYELRGSVQGDIVVEKDHSTRQEEK